MTFRQRPDIATASHATSEIHTAQHLPDDAHVHSQEPQPPDARGATRDAPAGTDPSFPAFALPFQDITTSNHIAQWTETVVPIGKLRP